MFWECSPRVANLRSGYFSLGQQKFSFSSPHLEFPASESFSSFPTPGALSQQRNLLFSPALGSHSQPARAILPCSLRALSQPLEWGFLNGQKCVSLALGARAHLSLTSPVEQAYTSLHSLQEESHSVGHLRVAGWHWKSPPVQEGIWRGGNECTGHASRANLFSEI